MNSKRNVRLTLYIVFLLTLNLSSKTQTNPCKTLDERQFNGAYRLADGRIVSILPSATKGHWRITYFNTGATHKLSPTDGLSFTSAGDFDSETPVEFRYRLNLNKDGLADSVAIKQNGKRELIAKKIKFREETAIFKSGEIELFGKLTLPSKGKPPFKTVIFVHGSEAESSVDHEWLPHYLASNGVAAFVFDKRGTGCSKGQYVQHFGVLSDDVIAAINWLKTTPDIDANRIGLSGFSQGGWVAPLAALKDPSVKFIVISYGMAMSVAEEDRLEAPLKLKEKGFDEASIAEFQELNAALHKIARENFKDWGEFEEKVGKYKDRKWFSVVKELQTWAGTVFQMGIPQAKVVAPQLFGNFFQPFYEPVPTLEKLNIRMLWLIADKDIEAPPEPTIDVLKRLRTQGKPFSAVIFPNADHGMFEFKVRNGKRVRTKYADNYFSTMLRWIQSQK